MASSLRADTARRARRRARRVGAAGFLLAAGLPVVLWHGVIGGIASEFRLDLRYLVTGWAPWILMATGLGCFAAVMARDWRDPERRFYGPGSGALMGWGLTLYLLGFLLATQVAQIVGELAPS